MRAARSIAFIMLVGTGFSSAAEPPKRERQPDVPAPVLQELRARGCKIAEKQPKNIIHGEFFRPGQIDWVALCSLKSNTALLVFPEGAREHVAVLETNPKGFSKWSIRAIDREQMQSMLMGWQSRRDGSRLEPAEIDHEGIGSVLTFGEPERCLYCFSEDGAVYYYDQERWLTPMRIMAN